MHLATTLIVIFWLIFLAFWFVSAFSAKKTINPWQSRPFLIRVIMILLLILIFQVDSIRQILSRANPNPNFWLSIAAVILAAAGIALAIWARVYLGSNWGMPMSLKENPELVTTGPYRYIRHPIYTGSLVAILGSALIEGNFWLVLFVFILAYFIYSARIEEGIMAKEFPDKYPEYKRRTKMLIPFVF